MTREEMKPIQPDTMTDAEMNGIEEATAKFIEVRVTYPIGTVHSPELRARLDKSMEKIK